MKKLLLIPVLVSVLAACSHSGAGDKQAELDSLKKQKQAIEERIKQLESEIGSKGSVIDKAVRVVVAEVKPTTFEHYIELQGKVDAEENVTVTPQMPGTIDRVYVSVGNQVKKGQVLASVDGATIQAQIDAVQQNLDFAKTLYQKQKLLWEQSIGTEVQYLQAKNQMESLEKQLNTLNEQYALTKLISPINGVVDAVDIKVGQVGSPGMAGIRVVNFNLLKVKGDVSESYSLQVHEGDKVKILFPDLNKELESKITYVGKVINPQSRTFTIESRLQGQEGYKPNMIAVLKIQDYENKAAITAEVNRIQKSGDGSYIYVAADENGRKVARRQPVTVGRIYRGIAEITSGLKPGDQVITIGYQDLVAGQAIQY
jgi:RND family efflux transporter MFP subunit